MLAFLRKLKKYTTMGNMCQQDCAKYCNRGIKDKDSDFLV